MQHRSEDNPLNAYLKSGMTALRGDLDGIIAFCRSKVA